MGKNNTPLIGQHFENEVFLTCPGIQNLQIATPPPNLMNFIFYLNKVEW